MGYGEEYVRKSIIELKKQNKIEVYNKDNLKGIRLTNEYKKELKRRDKRYKKINKTSANKSEKNRRIRLHKIAEIMEMMYRGNIKVYGREKPSLERVEIEKLNEREEAIFYNSLELKRVNSDKFKQVSSSRFIGMLLLQNTQYIIYNTGNRQMRWSSQAENRLLVFMMYLNENNKYQDSTRRIMVGDNIEMIVPLLDSVNNKPTKIGFRLDLQEEYFHFIPKNEKGILMLRLLSKEKEYQKLVATLTNKYQRLDNYAIEYKTKGDKKVIVCFLLDMVKLVKFKKKIEKEGGVVICFEFQKDVIREYLGEIKDVEYIVYDSLKVGGLVFESK